MSGCCNCVFCNLIGLQNFCSYKMPYGLATRLLSTFDGAHVKIPGWCYRKFDCSEILLWHSYFLGNTYRCQEI